MFHSGFLLLYAFFLMIIAYAIIRIASTLMIIAYVLIRIGSTLMIIAYALIRIESRLEDLILDNYAK
ncbi:hypothetical protein BCT24_11920 [Vibrio splendidus]|nr:hypothetical protein BCT24_11920 [Vibrio splendidus]